MGGNVREIRLNTDTGFLKIIAMATMLIDHVGARFFPAQDLFRIVGRISFPLYAFCLAVGCVYTKKPLRYALRILGLAILSQPIYVLALSHVSAEMNAAIAGGLNLRSAFLWYAQSMKSANILFTLFLGLVLLIGIREKKYIVSGICVLAAWYFSSYINYGWRGVALIVLFYAFLNQPLSSLFWVGGFMAWWGITGGGSYSVLGVRFGMQTFAMLALPLIYIPTGTGMKIGKWFSYVFYPAHLAAIYAVARFLVGQG